MSIRTAKIIRILLLVIACFAFFIGLALSQSAAKKAATDTTKIQIQIIEKNAYYNQYESPYTNGCYHIEYTYKITNNTEVAWTYLNITTYVYDVSGESLGTMTSRFGSSYGTSDFKLDVGKSVTKKTSIEDNNPNDFFRILYEKDLSDLRFEFEITGGTYKD